MEEIWKDIKGYEGKYQVSNLGKVKSLNYLRTGKEGFIKMYDNKNGYLYVNLNGKMFRVHRLVAEAFIENPNKLTDVNHIDENKYNNCASNLEWMSHKDNVNYGNCINKRRKVMTDKKGIKIYQYTKDCEFIKEYCSIHEASRQTGITYECIRQTADKYGKRGNLLTAGGFIWSKYRK